MEKKLSPTTRRHFIRSSALLAGASGLITPPLLSAPQAHSQENAGETSGVGLAVATICTDGFANLHHKPAFRIIPKTGIQAVEFNLWYPELLAPSYIDSIASRCEKTGLVPASIQGTSFGGEGHSAVMNDVAHKLCLMQIAKRLGCRRVKCTGSRRGTNGGLEHVIAVCRELAPMAEELDVLLVLENHVGNVLERAEDYSEIFSSIDSTHVGMCLDTGHFEGAGISLPSIVDQFRNRIQHVDLKDARAFGKGHDTVKFGQGITQFDPFLEDLIEGGYTGYLVIEMAWKEPREPLTENLREARERFERFVQQ
ncbi:sugar phosphate isomerase/epimerase family protein [Pelagicoccus sp. SDUM812002]|uniref:sugar phosphate isomerase/epimerase family protein n=1 Tax=Pelagicoccus sp. SDUM812002 TaxID=3041266 RepID=UPI00280D1377|nr:sugar phosphate isomerase/epimerase family protein [Pelagicoccus sp. SDUM812002]MDQ8184738.1 sugar phosphate isomerase/epimerase [Pelagicoccus sp. SDUM812002]